MNSDAFKLASPKINEELMRGGRGSSVIFKRSSPKPGFALYEYRLCTKIYGPDDDYGTIGIKRYIASVSCSDSERVKILQIEDIFTETTIPANASLYISDGEVRLVHSESAAAKSDGYRKLF